jgi:acyl-CoA dehydrogenase
MISCPRDTPGVDGPAGHEVFGNTDSSHGGHAEITFTDVRVRPPTSSR